MIYIRDEIYAEILKKIEEFCKKDSKFVSLNLKSYSTERKETKEKEAKMDRFDRR